MTDSIKRSIFVGIFTLALSYAYYLYSAPGDAGTEDSETVADVALDTEDVAVGNVIIDADLVSDTEDVAVGDFTDRELQDIQRKLAELRDRLNDLNQHA